MTFNKKIITGFLLIIVLSLFVSLYQIYEMTVMRHLEEEVSRRADDAAEVSEYMEHIFMFYADVADAIINRNIDEAEKSFAEHKETVEKNIKVVKEKADHEDERQWAEQYGIAINDMVQLVYTELLPELKKEEISEDALIAVDEKIDAFRTRADENLEKYITALQEEKKEAVKEFDDVTNTTILVTIIVIIIAMIVAFTIMYLIVKSLKKSLGTELENCVDMAQKIGQGDFSSKYTLTGVDDTSLLFAMDQMAQNIKSVISDINHASEQSSEGNLDYRIDSSTYKGDYQSIAQGFNNTLEALIQPINVTAEYVDRISKGDIPPKITDTYKGDFNEIKNNLNQAIDVMNGLLDETNKLIIATKEGQLDARGNSGKFVGGWAELISGVNELIDAFVAPINVTAEYVDRISKGDIPPRIVDEYKGDFNEIKNNLNQCIDIMNGLLAETNSLISATKKGQLDKRGESEKFIGGWAELVGGVNELIDAFVAPINVTAEYIDRVSKGDIPPKIEDTYHGDFNEIKNNINGLIDNLNNFIAEMKHMSKEHDLGDIDVVIDTKRFMGAYSEMAQGVNDMVNGHISVKKKAMAVVKEFGEGNFDAPLEKFPGKKKFINDTIEQVRGNIKAFIADMNHMSHEHDLGDIDVVMDEAKFKGAYQEMAKGVNGMVNGHISVKKKAMAVVKEFGDGNFDAPLEQFPGKKKFINETIEMVRNNIKSFIENMRYMAEQHDLGDIDVIMEADKFKGAYKLMAQGVNDMVNGHITVKKKAIACVKEFGLGNFDAPLEQFPGKKKFINETIELVRDNLKSFGKELQDLSDAAEEGNLSDRGDAAKFGGDWAKLVRGINGILDSILEPINDAANALSIMSTGDLTSRITADYQGDHRKLKDSINTLSDSLSSLIRQVLDMANNVAGIAGEMTANAESMAAGAQEQSAQADDVATAVEEMSRTITENAMSANRTSDEARKNGDVAKEGGDVVHQTVQKMRDIAEVVKRSAENMEKLGDSSTKIGEIISVIDDIADQTNLLALNAAIEAARAGEQGRGFAVVADEVRKLAERTTEATQQIAVMIKGIQSETQNAVHVMKTGNEEVTYGITLADKAGEALSKIVDSTDGVLNMINQIAAASEEQSSTSEQISKNVSNISAVSNDSANKINEIAGAADELSKLIHELANSVALFKVSEGGHTDDYAHKSLSSSESRLLS